MQPWQRASVFLSTIFVLSGQAGLAAPTAHTIAADTSVTVQHSYGQIPLGFEANQGQTGEQVKFFARGSGYGVWLTSTEAVLALHKRKPVKSGGEGEGRVIRLGWMGANPAPQVTGHEQLPGVSHYLAGRASQWRTHVTAYSRVHYGQVYPGIDLVWYGNQGELEYDWVVGAHANPGLIKLNVVGADRLEVDEQGDLLLHVGTETLKQRKPLIYQQVNGQRRQVAGGYTLRDKQEVGLWVAGYERSLPLVIDPVLAYSTYLGGNQEEIGQGIAVDASGSAYITGATPSLNFPATAGSLQTTSGGNWDAFVTRLNTSGSALVFSTYLGGGDDDLAVGIALSDSGDAYVVGQTFSSDFPTTTGAYQTVPGGDSDVFVARLDATGSTLVYSTYLGNTSFDVGLGIAVDSAGNARVTGYTTGDFPTTSGAVQQTYSGGAFDAFVGAFNATGNTLVYSTYLGGESNDIGLGVAVDPSGNTYVAGVTLSTDFPTTTEAYQPVNGGDSDAFVTAFDTTGRFVYSTYLGGTGSDDGRAVAVDSAGNAYITGFTSGGGFPTTAGSFRTTPAGAQDIFVTKLNTTGSALDYSTYLGGNGNELGFGIAVDRSGKAYVTGNTSSVNFPTTNGAFQATSGGGTDAFTTGLSATGATLVYSTYLGGGGEDFGNGIVVGPAANVYVVGTTSSNNFPTTTRAFQTNSGGFQDAFVTRLNVRGRAAGR